MRYAAEKKLRPIRITSLALLSVREMKATTSGAELLAVKAPVVLSMLTFGPMYCVLSTRTESPEANCSVMSPVNLITQR